jgi:hypothetical protein
MRRMTMLRFALSSLAAILLAACGGTSAKHRPPPATGPMAAALPESGPTLVDDESRRADSEEPPAGIALMDAPRVVVSVPPWQATPPQRDARKAPRLVKLSSKKASPTRNTAPVFDPSQPFFIAPADKGRVPPGARTDIPTAYADTNLGAIIPDQATSSPLILIYGGRYVAIVRGDEAERVFDLETFRHPPKVDPKQKDFAVEDATYAQERDGVLYVCNGGGSYAREVYGKKGFLSALDATTGELRWRSAPLTCSATFAIADDYLVTGYGFTGEPDFLFLVRRSDGAIVQKLPIDSGPDTIGLSGNHVHVESYGSVTELELR